MVVVSVYEQMIAWMSSLQFPVAKGFHYLLPPLIVECINA